jgi:hypothetical protein
MLGRRYRGTERVVKAILSHRAMHGELLSPAGRGMIKAIYWVFVAVDTMGLLLLFVLGLAAAGPSRTNPMSVALYLLVLPGLGLVSSILLFVRSHARAWRVVGFVVAAAPVVLCAGTLAFSRAQFLLNSNELGELTFFRAGPKRDIVEAIRRNDAPTVAALVPQVDVNDAGMDGMTLLISALRQLRDTPDRQEVLEVLLAAGADPNKGTEYEVPLEMALQTVERTGPRPVKLLLEAGANPNRTTLMGPPIYFGGAGNGVSTEVMTMLLDHGADLNATGPKGERVLFYAADARNWKAVLLLLERGVDWRQGRSFSGKSFKSMLEANAAWASADPGFADVMSHLARH